MNIRRFFTDNNVMNEAMVYLTAIGFAISIFPVHLYNYLYINTETRYAGLNIGVYRYLNFFNANTIEDKPGEMQVNGKNKKMDLSAVRASAYKIFDTLCIYKIVQMGDYGLKDDKSAYVALFQSAFSTAIYKFIQAHGNYAKLRNYTILNEEHGFLRYYLKAVTIINFIVVGKIILILIMEKLNVKN